MTLIETATHYQSQLDQLTERMGTITQEHAEAIKAKDDALTALQQQFNELATYKAEMEKQVTTVLQSGDPAQYEALAVAFLTPAEEKARQEKLARIEFLKAETAALEASLVKP